MTSKLNILLCGSTLILSSISYANEQKLDLTSDNFDVFDHLADEYVETHHNLKPFTNKRTFGKGYTSFNNNTYPKVGFIGLEYSNGLGKDQVVKLQLFKNQKGWAVVNTLDNTKIHQANPTYMHDSKNKRDMHLRNAKLAAAMQTELWLNQQDKMDKVRSTSVNCYVTKDGTKASCHTIYGLKEAEKVACYSKSYLMEQNSNSWKASKEIDYNQRVSYSNGELKVIKPFSKRCS